MKKRYKLLTVLVALTLITAGGAVLTKQYYHPHEATVAGLSLAEYFDGELYSNETKVSWGTNLIAGETYNKTYGVHNTGDLTCKVVLTVENLPTGWNLTWTGNNTIIGAGTDVIGKLQLKIPATATEGTYNWTTYTTPTQP